MQKLTKVDESLSCELHVTIKKQLLSPEIPEREHLYNKRLQIYTFAYHQ